MARLHGTSQARHLDTAVRIFVMKTYMTAFMAKTPRL
jgi:hypothetical protein